jgi:predicted DCC family thiol-disulfide oxidoreductase YuxK
MTSPADTLTDTAAEPGRPARDPGADPCTVYHDGSCPLCRAEISLYRRLTPDRPMRFVDVSTTAPDDVVSGDLCGADAMARFHVRDPDGRLVSGAEAFGVLWRNYRGFRWLGHLVRWPVIGWLTEGAYRLFLVTVRPLLQRAMRAREARRADAADPR